MKRSFRNWLFTLHTWLGLHLSIFFTFMFLTGSLLVAGVELELIGRSTIWTTITKEDRTASFGLIYNGIKSAHPESKIAVVEKSPVPWLVDQTSGRTGWGERVNFWTDPKTGEVIDVTGDFGFRKLVRELHDNFLSGQLIIYLAICATSGLLMYQIFSGLISYRRFWRGFFRGPKGAFGSRSWSGTAHRLAAVWATPLLLVTAVTGFFFFLIALGLEGSRPIPQPPVARGSILPNDFSTTTLDLAEEQARAALPGFEPTVLRLPANKSESFKFFGHIPDIADIWGPSSVVIDPETLEVLGAFTPRDNTGLARWAHVIEMLHYGFWGGVFSRVIWLVLGLTATGVALTGAMIYAARLTPDDPGYSPLRRFWRGLGLFRWVYLLVLLGIFAVSYLRFSPDSYRATRIYTTDTVNAGAHLLLRSPLRRNTPIQVELHLDEPDLRAAKIELNGDAVLTADLRQDDEDARIQVAFDPAITANDLTARLERTDGSEKTYTFRLGAPIW